MGFYIPLHVTEFDFEINQWTSVEDAGLFKNFANSSRHLSNS